MHALGWYNEGLKSVEKFRALFPDETEFCTKMKHELDKSSALESELAPSVILTILYIM